MLLFLVGYVLLQLVTGNLEESVGFYIKILVRVNNLKGYTTQLLLELMLALAQVGVFHNATIDSLEV